MGGVVRRSDAELALQMGSMGITLTQPDKDILVVAVAALNHTPVPPGVPMIAHWNPQSPDRNNTPFSFGSVTEPQFQPLFNLLVDEATIKLVRRKGDSNCLDCQARRGAPAFSETRMPQLTDERFRPPNSVSHPCDAGSMAHATVRACSEFRRDDPRCPTVFEDLGYVGLSRLGCLKAYRERTPT